VGDQSFLLDHLEEKGKKKKKKEGVLWVRNPYPYERGKGRGKTAAFSPLPGRRRSVFFYILSAAGKKEKRGGRKEKRRSSPGSPDGEGKEESSKLVWKRGGDEPVPITEKE